MNTSSYLELNWLAKADKHILLPPVIFTDIKEGGFLHFPEKKEVLIGNKYYPADRGLIVVNCTYPDMIESVLAHEWRHLWQYYQWGKPASVAQWNSSSPLTYKEQIVKYFTTDSKEYDALLFELEKVPNDTVLEWYEWIIKR